MVHRDVHVATASEGRDNAVISVFRLMDVVAHLRSDRRLAIAFPASARGMSKDCDLQSSDSALSASSLSCPSTTAAATDIRRTAD